jgi:hypothetical protein
MRIGAEVCVEARWVVGRTGLGVNPCYSSSSAASLDDDDAQNTTTGGLRIGVARVLGGWVGPRTACSSLGV